MKTLLLCLCVLGTQSIAKDMVKFEHYQIEPKQAKSFTARITFYSPHEKNYIYGTKIASNPKGKAIEGYSVAVDPKKIPYGSTLYIPELSEIMDDGVFCAVDTGSAVKKLRAIPKSKRGQVNHVIDVFVDSNETMNRLSNSMPQYMTVYLYE